MAQSDAFPYYLMLKHQTRNTVKKFNPKYLWSRHEKCVGNHTVSVSLSAEYHTDIKKRRKKSAEDQFFSGVLSFSCSLYLNKGQGKIAPTLSLITLNGETYVLESGRAVARQPVGETACVNTSVAKK